MIKESYAGEEGCEGGGRLFTGRKVVMGREVVSGKKVEIRNKCS